MCWSTDGTMYAWTPSLCINFRSSAKRSVVFTFAKDGWKRKEMYVTCDVWKMVKKKRTIKEALSLLGLGCFCPGQKWWKLLPVRWTAGSIGRRLSQKARSVWVINQPCTFSTTARKYLVLNTISLESSHLKKDFGDSQWRAAVNARGLRC